MRPYLQSTTAAAHWPPSRCWRRMVEPGRRKPGAAAPAIPVTDTVKRAREGLIEETVDRSELWTVQTPQVFEAGLIRAAVEKAVVDGESLTDECGAVERLGMKVSLTTGSKENIKTPPPLT